MILNILSHKNINRPSGRQYGIYNLQPSRQKRRITPMEMRVRYPITNTLLGHTLPFLCLETVFVDGTSPVTLFKPAVVNANCIHKHQRWKK